MIIEIAKVVRVGYLQQNAFHKNDTYVPMEKQLKMMEVDAYLKISVVSLIEIQVKSCRKIIGYELFLIKLLKMKYDNIPNDNIDKLDTYYPY